MLTRKLFRTAWKYKSQFLSMIIMVAIGMGIFLGFNIEWYSLEKDVGAFFEETKYADFRIYSESGFSAEDLKNIQEISGVEAAGRMLRVNVGIKDSKKAVALLVSENYEVSTMHIMEGAGYDKNSEGIWLLDRFAKANGIEIGDEISLVYQGIDISGKVEGFAKSGEIMVCTADDNQIMPDPETFGFAYITPKKYEKVLKAAYPALEKMTYPQINIISDMEKDKMEEAVSKALGRTIMVVPKEDHVVYAAYKSEVAEGEVMSSILPVLFLAIGILTMVTTMHRIAANEKIQIGTLKALGFRDRKILWHYTSYGLFIGIVGTTLGVLMGYGLAAVVISPDGMMGTYFDMPDWTLYMPAFCIPVLILAVAFLTLISFWSVKAMLRGTAADALRPYVPKAVKKSFLENLSFWEKLPFGTKWNLRDMFRHKARSAMTLIGVIGCMLLLVGGLGMKDTMDEYLVLIDETVNNYGTKVNLADTATNEEAVSLAKELEGDYGASSGISYGGRTVMLEVYDAERHKIRFADADNQIVELSDEGVYLCQRLKDSAGIGEEITFSPYGSEKTYTVKVAGYLRSVLTENIVMTADYADRLGLEYHISSIYTDKDIHDIPDSGLVTGKQDKRTLMDTYNSFMEILNVMILMFVFGAVVLGIVVLYNLGVMSYIERSRELATLKVLGFRDKKIGKLLISQNVWLTVLGVMIGLPGGVAVLQMLIVALGSDYELKLKLGVLTYSVSILVTFGVSLFVGFLVARKNRYINMVEALKDAE